MKAITTKDLTKCFGNLVAVNKVSLDIEAAEVFGMLGPNGAGKTTFTKILSTLLRPTSGYAEVWGNDVVLKPDEVRRCIGIVFQDPAIDEKLTARENLEFHARMYGISRNQREKRIAEVLDLVELTDKADIQLEAYSSGMQRRLEIARGLMHHPKVLFLDEPTLGLDVQTRRHIWEYIKSLNRREGVTVFLMTHYMEEADYLCGRIAIIDEGEIIALDTPANLKRLIGSDVITIQTDAKSGLGNLLRNFAWVDWVTENNTAVNIGVRRGETKIPQIVIAAHQAGISIKSISIREPDLEDVFLKFTGRKMRDDEGDARQHFRRVVRAFRRKR
ncbi:MAG TPA: ATP-binding cassette domain-containing protein [Dehalococcoidales bacterium]|nr:ATP-binding cassette domain-containing protein [Dehalococcoidales bacterium]